MMRRHLALLAVLCATVLGAGLSGQALADGAWPGPDGPAARGAARHRRATPGGSTAPTSIRSRTCRWTTSGPGAVRGAYTSAANIGVYLWAVVAARDLTSSTPPRRERLAAATLDEVAPLKRYDGFLYQWYDTDNGNVLLNPGQGDCTETTPPAGQLLVRLGRRQRLVRVGADRGAPGAAGRARPGQPAAGRRWTSPSSTTTAPRPTATPTRRCRATSPPARCTAASTSTRARPATTTARCTPTRGSPCTSAWACTRCPATSGGGRGERCRPSAAPPTRTSPGRASGRRRGTGRPTPTRSRGKQFHVWEGHYAYPGTSLTFIPTFAGGMFEGLMANLVVPETTWGTHSFGLADLRWAQVQERYATQVLHYPGLGDVAVEHRRRHRQLRRLRRRGAGLPGRTGAGSVHAPAPTETTVSPHASAIALPVIPQAAYANLQALRTLYPGVYSADGGFYDAVNPHDGLGRPPAAGARPVDDHGRARRRAQRRRATALLRQRPACRGRRGRTYRPSGCRSAERSA